jgi:hypothetical protein
MMKMTGLNVVGFRVDKKSEQNNDDSEIEYRLKVRKRHCLMFVSCATIGPTLVPGRNTSGMSLMTVDCGIILESIIRKNCYGREVYERCIYLSRIYVPFLTIVRSTKHKLLTKT